MKARILAGRSLEAEFRLGNICAGWACKFPPHALNVRPPQKRSTMRCLSAPKLNVWVLVAEQANISLNSSNTTSFISSFEQIGGLHTEDQEWARAVVLTAAWNIWKNRNRETLEGKSSQPSNSVRKVLFELKECPTANGLFCRDGSTPVEIKNSIGVKWYPPEPGELN